MDEIFNPYYAFLGLDEEVTAPNYFQLLRLKEGESDPARIAAGADKAAARVRSCRPGTQMAVWLKLLDEIKTARECLLDTTQREGYLREGPKNDNFKDNSAQESSLPVQNSPVFTQSAAPSMVVYRDTTANYGYPPGGYPPGALPTVPAYQAPQPQGAYGYPAAGPMAPVGYGWQAPQTPPAGPMLAPPVAPMPNPLDPMAPVTYPVHREASYGVAASGPQAPYVVPVALPAHPVVAMAVPAAPVEAAVTDGLGLPGQPATSRPVIRRKNKVPVMLVGGIGGTGLVVVGLIIAFAMSGGPEALDELQFAEKKPSVKTQTTLLTQPTKTVPSKGPSEERRPEVKPVVVPSVKKPEVTSPTPKPNPEEMKPEPEPVKPTPKPEPKPETPIAAELAELSRLMKEAKTALGDFTFGEADDALAKAEKLAKLPEHQAKVERLKKLAGLAKQFRQAILKTMAALQAGEVIKIGASNEAAIVEATPKKLIIRIAGANKSYTIEELPLGLAASLGERSLDANSPKTRVLKGAYVLCDRRSDPSQRNKAKTWWEEAELSGVEGVGELMPVITDTYDFQSNASSE